MYQNNKRIFILAGVIVLMFAGQAMSQTRVLGLFQLGESTYDEVKTNLPKEVQITVDNGKLGASEDGGPIIVTNGAGYGIDGLKDVGFLFDKNQTLAEVRMRLEGRRFDDVKKILASKYRTVRSNFLYFKANRDYVSLSPQRDKNIGFGVVYKTGDVYRQEQLQERQTVEYNKKYERENKKAFEREAAEEAEKF